MASGSLARSTSSKRCIARATLNTRPCMNRQASLVTSSSTASNRKRWTLASSNAASCVYVRPRLAKLVETISQYAWFRPVAAVSADARSLTISSRPSPRSSPDATMSRTR